MHFLLINTSKTLMILIVLEVLIMLFNYSLYDTLNTLLHIPYENGFFNMLYD
ncbi:hypothetical protein HMPREF0776_2299 [Staphylococcus aureus subsp. aureus USA300_TCH959]|nr:hypothetical protein HMPREF0776_2299 [Staphylococcus aureus subsp. aureus USA300_TCH959]